MLGVRTPSSLILHSAAACRDGVGMSGLQVSTLVLNTVANESLE